MIESMVVLLSVVRFYSPGCNESDFIFVFLFGLFIISVMDGSESHIKAAMNRFMITGRYAYTIYCCHIFIATIIKHFFAGHNFYLMLIIYLPIVFFVSFTINNLSRFIKGLNKSI